MFMVVVALILQLGRVLLQIDLAFLDTISRLKIAPVQFSRIQQHVFVTIKLSRESISIL